MSGPTPDQVRGRFRGALLGLAVGEALGAPAEFLTASQIAERFGVITDMLGGGCNDLAPGETTDATEMMLCLAESLADSGDFVPEDIMRRYVAWFDASPRDVSLTVRTVMLSRQRFMESPPGPGASPRAAGRCRAAAARSRGPPHGTGPADRSGTG